MSKLNCTKCGGNHLSIRCGKKKLTKNKTYNKKDKKYKSKFNKVKYNKKNNYRGKYKVILKNLPKYIEQNNISRELNKYGISNFVLKKYDTAIAFIEFYNLEHAKHFVNALNNTACGNMIITAELSNN